MPVNFNIFHLQSIPLFFSHSVELRGMDQTDECVGEVGGVNVSSRGHSATTDNWEEKLLTNYIKYHCNYLTKSFKKELVINVILHIFKLSENLMSTERGRRGSVTIIL